MLQLYQNIRKLRLEKGLSQEKLAEMVGYKSGKSMISKVEQGKVDLTQGKIKEFAAALGVTAGELMGWDNDENKEKPPVDFITAKNTSSRMLAYSLFVPPEDDINSGLLNEILQLARKLTPAEINKLVEYLYIMNLLKTSNDYEEDKHEEL